MHIFRRTYVFKNNASSAKYSWQLVFINNKVFFSPPMYLSEVLQFENRRAKYEQTNSIILDIKCQQ